MNIFLKDVFIYYLRVIFMSLCTTFLLEPKRGQKMSDGCKPTHECWKFNLSFLQERQDFLTAELFLNRGSGRVSNLTPELSNISLYTFDQTWGRKFWIVAEGIRSLGLVQDSSTVPICLPNLLTVSQALPSLKSVPRRHNSILKYLKWGCWGRNKWGLKTHWDNLP